MTRHDTQDFDSQTAVDCRVVDLAPCLFNGSLADDERAEVEAHLETCESCRVRFAEELQIWQLMTAHVPSFDLAEYAQGLDPQETPRRLIEQHLAVCESCREEFALARDLAADEDLDDQRAQEAQGVPVGRVVDFASARRRTMAMSRRVPAWRAVSAAAAVLVTVMSGAFWMLGGTPPAADGTFAERDLAPSAAATTPPQADDQPAHAASETVLFQDGFESGELPGWSMIVNGKVKE